MGKRVTLNVINDLYSEPDKNGKDKLIKRNIKTRMNIDIDMFEMPIEIINSKGNVVKNKCRIYVRDVGPMTIAHTWDEIMELKKDIRDHRTIVKGFLK